MQLLANYAASFAEAVQQAATTLPAATEVKLGSGAVLSVVETGPQQIIIRMNGRNRRYPVGQLPLGLAVALVSTCRGAIRRPWRKAAYLVVHPETDQQGTAKAKGWLHDVAHQVPDAHRILRRREGRTVSRGYFATLGGANGSVSDDTLPCATVWNGMASPCSLYQPPFQAVLKCELISSTKRTNAWFTRLAAAVARSDWKAVPAANRGRQVDSDSMSSWLPQWPTGNVDGTRHYTSGSSWMFLAWQITVFAVGLALPVHAEYLLGSGNGTSAQPAEPVPPYGEASGIHRSQKPRREHGTSCSPRPRL